MQFDRSLNTIKKAKQRGLIPLLCFVCWCFARVFLNTFRFSFFLRFVFQRHDFSIFRLYKELEKYYDVYIITQNVDDLHERAGSSRVLHLHGELMKVRTIEEPTQVYTLDEEHLETTPDSTDAQGRHLRPHIVFFQEAVPNIERAVEWTAEADVFVVIGTSLAVYPAASLLHYVRAGVPVYYIDPNPAPVGSNVTVIRKGASEGIAELAEILGKSLQN